MSIIFFYQRIFDGPHIRRVLWGTHLFNISLAIAYVIAQCFVSQPLYCEWTFDQGKECTYHDAFDGSGAYSALNAALDLWLVTLAAFLVWKLQMKAAKRLSVIAVFATGFLQVVFRPHIQLFIRLAVSNNVTSGHSAQHSSDSSFGVFQTTVSTPSRFLNQKGEILMSFSAKETTFPSLTWATYYAVYIELTACFIIACLPAIRQLTDKVLPTIRHYTTLMCTKYKSNRRWSRADTSPPASPRLWISKAQEIGVITSSLDPNARKNNDWDPERRESRMSR
jgi:hypothetical protein